MGKNKKTKLPKEQRLKNLEIFNEELRTLKSIGIKDPHIDWALGEQSEDFNPSTPDATLFSISPGGFTYVRENYTRWYYKDTPYPPGILSNYIHKLITWTPTAKRDHLLFELAFTLAGVDGLMNISFTNHGVTLRGSKLTLVPVFTSPTSNKTAGDEFTIILIDGGFDIDQFNVLGTVSGVYGSDNIPIAREALNLLLLHDND